MYWYLSVVVLTFSLASKRCILASTNRRRKSINGQTGLLWSPSDIRHCPWRSWIFNSRSHPEGELPSGSEWIWKSHEDCEVRSEWDLIVKINCTHFFFCSQILRADSSNTEGLYIRGRGLYYSGNFAQAINHYSQALRLDPDFSKARMELKKVTNCFCLMYSLLCGSPSSFFYLTARYELSNRRNNKATMPLGRENIRRPSKHTQKLSQWIPITNPSTRNSFAIELPLKLRYRKKNSTHNNRHS